VSENRELRIAGGGGVAGGWRGLHNEELHNLYASPNIFRAIKSKRMTAAINMARMGVVRYAYEILVGNSEGKRQLGRPRRR
jgi:hypothetical protein